MTQKPDERPAMTGAQYLYNRIAEREGPRVAELEMAVATLLDQKAAVEKERDELKEKLAEKEKPASTE